MSSTRHSGDNDKKKLILGQAPRHAKSLNPIHMIAHLKLELS